MPFKNIIVKKTVNNGGGGVPSSVEDERLTYDNRNSSDKALDTLAVDIESLDPSKKVVETVQAAVLAVANETSQLSTETILSDIVGQVTEQHRKSEDETLSFDAALVEVVAKASEAVSTDVELTEQAIKAIESSLSDIIGDVTEVNKQAVETITAAIAAVADINDKADTVDFILLDVNAYTTSVSRSTGWTSPNNVIGNTPNSAATLSATSSGFLGTTSNTTTGELVVAVRSTLGPERVDTSLPVDPTSNPRLEFVVERTDSGLLSQPTSNVTFGIANSPSGPWQNQFTITTELAKQTIVTSLSGFDPADYTRRFIYCQADGSVTSGTGVGAGTTVSFYSFSKHFTASGEQ